MPLHDWTRVGEHVFRSFHGAWIHWLMRTLNADPDDPELRANPPLRIHWSS